jgi:hypothetical protein
MRFTSQEPTDQEVLKAAAAIRSRMRKTHRGGRPCRKHVCRWCGIECLGLRALGEHERDCPSKADVLPGIPDLRSLLL